jgi:hypothetical protein
MQRSTGGREDRLGRRTAPQKEGSAVSRKNLSLKAKLAA